MIKNIRYKSSHHRLTAFLGMLILIFTLSSLAWGQQAAPALEKNLPPKLTASEQTLSQQVKVETITEVTKVLSSPEMEGRGTATPGGEKAAQYIADRFAKLGLKPLGDSSTYLQGAKFKSTQVSNDTNIKVGELILKQGQDLILSPPYVYGEKIDVTGELVFLGYGVLSEELKHNDFKDLDLKGKIVVIARGKPKKFDDKTWQDAANIRNFLINLTSRGVAGIIYEAFPKKEEMDKVSKYFVRRQVQLADAPEIPFKIPPTFLTTSESLTKLFAGQEKSFAQLIMQAENDEYVSGSLNKTATLSATIKTEVGTGSNVVAVLPGSDSKLKEEAVVFTAHYDAFGLAGNGKYYPGAADNALGVGSLVSIAEAFTKLPEHPKRTLIFLAVTGEEYGLLGAQYWVNHSTWPIDKVAADINFDGIGTETYGPVKMIVGYGKEYSTLGTTLEEVVAAMGNTNAPDPFPEEKVFYRSDHFAFVQKGVPAIMLAGSPENVTEVLARAHKYLETDYHDVTDAITPDWNWEGPRTLSMVGFLLGWRVANNEVAPDWLPSAPFHREKKAEPVKAAN